MFRQRGARPSRGEWHETPLQALQKDVQRSGLQDVLNSLPAPDSFHFNKASKNDHETITLFLGNRPNSNGSTSQAWARIVSRSERKDFQPPLLFYDLELKGTRSIQYPRSASSLLRKATSLLPPFCFLQHDPIDGATNVRGMLSAITLYLAAATDVDVSAWQWDKFGDSLIQALRYIDSRGAFHEWQHQQKLAALAQSNPGDAAEETQEVLEQEIDARQLSDPATELLNTISAASNGRYLGGTVQSRGSDVAITPTTSLGKLKRVLGDRKFRMLDLIPPKPMTISRHDHGGTLFPFRMFVGNAVYQDTGEVIDIHAYIDHEDCKTSMYFMSYDKTGLEQMYDVNDMRDSVDLVQPLEYLNNLKKASYKNDAKSARTAKLRSLISYYFFLAENQGLISSPGIDVHEGFGKRLCAVCKELGMEKWDNDDEGASERDQAEHRKDTEIDRETRSPTRHAYEPAVKDTEESPKDGIDSEPSRSVGLGAPPDVSDVAINKSIEQNEDMPDRDSSTDQPPSENGEDITTLELNLRPSLQSSHGDPTGPSDGPGDLMEIDNYSESNGPAGAAPSGGQTMQLRSSQMGAAEGVSADEPSTAAPVPAAPTVEDTAGTAQSNHVRAESCADTNPVHRNIPPSSADPRFLVNAAYFGNGTGYEDIRRLMLRNDDTFHKMPQTAGATVGPQFPVSAKDLAKKKWQDQSEGGSIDLDQFVSKSIAYVRSVDSKHGEDDLPVRDDAEGEEVGVEDTFDWALFGRQACFPSSKRPPTTDFLLGPLSMQKKTISGAKGQQIQIPQSNEVQVEEAMEHVTSPPAPTPKVFRVSTEDTKKAITAWIDNGLQLGESVPNLLVAQIGGNKPPTPEGSAERDLKNQTEPAEPVRAAPQAPSAIEAILISDDENEQPEFPAPRSVIDRTPEARNHIRENVVDLTQLSSSPRGKKRKSLGPFYLSDSENDVINETDGSE